MNKEQFSFERSKGKNWFVFKLKKLIDRILYAMFKVSFLNIPASSKLNDVISRMFKELLETRNTSIASAFTVSQNSC